MQGRRVVVTGMGLVSPLGMSVDESWEGIKAGKSGISPKTWDSPDLDVRISGQVTDFDAVALFGKRDARRMDRITQLAMESTRQAIEHSRLEINDDNRHDIGVIMGTAVGGIETIMASKVAYDTRGPRSVSPQYAPMMLPDSPSGRISITWGIRGMNLCVTSACATGNNAIGEAAVMIARGAADIMVAGATEAAGEVDVSVASFNNMKALSHRNDEPEKASRPFDIDRDGFVMAEGAGTLILEDLDHALARGATIYGEILGYGATSDAYHVTAPMENGDGARRAMLKAIKDAGIEPEQIDYINAHGTGTPLNDSSETLAIKNALGELAYSIPVSSTKSMTGHMMGAAGAAEAIFCLRAMEESFIPPTTNLDNPDPVCDLDYVPHQGRHAELQYVMSNSFGFGGHNVVVILGKYQANGQR